MGIHTNCNWLSFCSSSPFSLLQGTNLAVRECIIWWWGSNGYWTEKGRISISHHLSTLAGSVSHRGGWLFCGCQYVTSQRDEVSPINSTHESVASVKVVPINPIPNWNRSRSILLIRLNKLLKNGQNGDKMPVRNQSLWLIQICIRRLYFVYQCNT